MSDNDKATAPKPNQNPKSVNKKKKQKKKQEATTPNGDKQMTQTKDLEFLNASNPTGKRADYGTNDTCELLERIPTQIVEMKLDEVLTAVKVVDNLCKYERCKAKTNLMGLDCTHCNKRFCFKHGLPEVHGCGEAVKMDERKQFLHPKLPKTIRAEQDLADAKKRLNAKLNDMKVQRLQKNVGGGEAKKANK